MKFREKELDLQLQVGEARESYGMQKPSINKEYCRTEYSIHSDTNITLECNKDRNITEQKAKCLRTSDTN